MTTLTLFNPIEKHRVTPTQPCGNGPDLDVERCAAMHNTLLLYGWICSGKGIPDMQKKSWWGRHGTAELKALLRPSLAKYLTKIFDVPGHNFFYHISGLASRQDMLELGERLKDDERQPLREEKHRYLVLYSTPKEHVSHPAGIVYDQETNKAILMPTYNHLFDFKNPHLPWQSLETMLSAYIDMVEAEKVVAIHDGVVEVSGLSINMGADRIANSMRPWVMQSYTRGDLERCLDVWNRLVAALETRSGVVKSDEEESKEPDPLCSRTALNVAGVSPGFAYDLLARAQYSQVWFIAPGIRLPKVEEFLNQPFKHIAKAYPKETANMKMPFLFLRVPGEVSASDAKFRYPFSTVESVPCGLYLDAFPNAQNPFEDACRLVLPIKLGSNKYARTSDFRPIRKSHSDLYQVEINPFVMRHGPKLLAILENWLENIESGHWAVNERGVEGGIGAWRQADTREMWWRYQSKHLFV
ncbi:hypothetical protein LTR95_016167 [Oleoguttula sp. CCFEE 5521]